MNQENLEKAVNLPWFRMYCEFISDPVVQSLAFEDQRHFVAVLCLKCSGVLDRDIAQSAKDRIIVRALGLDTTSADEAKRRLMEVGFIDKKWQPKSWDKRQYLSDHSTQRARKSRKTKETGNGNTPLQSRCCNGPDTDTDTDTEKRARSRASRLPQDWELPEDWESWAKQAGHPNPHGASEKFRDYWIAIAGQKGAKLDWKATWRNWIRGDLEHGAGKQAPVLAWQMSETQLLAEAKERGISTTGKTTQQLINELR